MHQDGRVGVQFPKPAQTLYRRALGEDFETLPSALRRFHGLPGGGHAAGFLRVMRGRGRLRTAAADLLKLPPAGERVGVDLQVVVEGDRERWIRRFGDDVRLVSTQRLEGGLIVETFGPFRFGFRLSGGPGGLRFDLVRRWLWGLALPARLAPGIEAKAAGRDEGWWIDVSIRGPLLGLLARYEGKMAPR